MIYFFTDYERLKEQTADPNQAYGPVAGSLTTQYRVTSLHTIVGGEANAYAICDGHLLAVESEVSGKLNLILRPTDQGEVTFAKIKFIIYRGVERDALLSGDMIADKSHNDVTAYLWKEFKKTEADPGKDLLLIDLPNDEWLEVAFLNRKMIPVSAGAKIGSFKAGETFGIEFVLEKLGQEMTIGDACLLSRVIDVLPADDTLLNKAAREKILGFMDPCSFYGMHILEGIGCRTLPQSSVSYIEETDLYQKILLKFARPNVVYVDIRNENGYPMDYYGNYGEAIQVRLGTGNEQEWVYGTHGWPLLELDFRDVVHPFSKKTALSIRFPEGDNTRPLVYLSNGYSYKEYPRKPEGSHRFFELSFNEHWTTKVDLAIPLIDNQTVGSYVQVYYIKQIDINKSLGNTPLANRRKYLDYIFPILPEYKVQRLEQDKVVCFQVLEDLKFVDASEVPLGFSGMVKTGIAIEAERVILFAYFVDYYQKDFHQLELPALTSGYCEGSFFAYLEKVFFNKNIQLIKGELKFQDRPSLFTLLFNNIGGNYSKENIFTLILSKEQFESLQNKTSEFQNDQHFTYLQIGNETSFVDDETVSVQVSEFKLGGIGHSEQFEQRATLIPVVLNSVDGLTFSSNEMVERENLEITNISALKNIYFTLDGYYVGTDGIPNDNVYLIWKDHKDTGLRVDEYFQPNVLLREPTRDMLTDLYSIIPYQKVVKPKLSIDTFQRIAGIVRRESAPFSETNDIREQKSIAYCILNFVSEKKLLLETDYSLAKFVHGIGGHAGVGPVLSIDNKKIDDRAAFWGVVYAFSRAIDPSNGSTHWDGSDLPEKGVNHPNIIDNGALVTKEHHAALKKFYTEYPWGKRILQSFSDFEGKHPAVGSERNKYNIGRVLYKSFAAYGGTMFWGYNKDAQENIGYDRKYLFR